MNPLSPIPPRSPFATSLSGSARETELRLRSIFQWKKRRPPALLLILTGTLILLCSSLVSCQAKAAPPAGPEFSLTGPGTETIPFENLLGYSGTVTHTIFDDYGREQYVYQLTLPDGKTCTLTECSG